MVIRRDNQELLAKGYGYDLGKISAQTEGNIKLENVRFGNTMKRDERQQEYAEKNAYIKAKIDEAYARLTHELEIGKLSYLENLKMELKDKAFRQQVAQLEVLADYYNFKGDEKKSFVIAGLEIKMPDSKTGKFDDKSIENAKKVHDSLDKRAENILKQLKDGALDLSDDEVQKLNAELEDIREFQRRLENQMGEQLGLGTVDNLF